MEVHIGDFSVAREHVHPFCHRKKCQQFALDVLRGTKRLHAMVPVSFHGRKDLLHSYGHKGAKALAEYQAANKKLGLEEDKLSRGEEFIVFSSPVPNYKTKGFDKEIKYACPGAKPGDVYLFLVDWPRSIHLNL